jgi:hypothetical protein
LFIDITEEQDKDTIILESVKAISVTGAHKNVFIKNSQSFTSLPNSIIGYNWEDYVINLFDNNSNLIKSKLQARDGHNLVSFNHFRLYWEVDKTNNFEVMYNGGLYSLFYFPYRELTMYGDEGYLVKTHKSTNFRNLTFQKEIGIGYGKRGEMFDVHPLKKNMIFTKEGQAISRISEEESYLLLSFLNSILVQFSLNLYSGQHKASGYVNLLPLPHNNDLDKDIKNQLLNIIKLKRKYYSFDETCLEFGHLLTLFSNVKSIKNKIQLIKEELTNDKKNYLDFLKNNDSYWLNNAGIVGSDLHFFDK